VPVALTPAQRRRQFGFLCLGVAAVAGGLSMSGESASWFQVSSARSGYLAPVAPQPPAPEPAMSMPRADDATRGFLADLLPVASGLSTRPMFGNLAAFANGYMFAGAFGDRVFVRLPPAARAELLDLSGAEPFAPLPDRPLAEYALLPAAWRDEPDVARAWVARSHAWVCSLPEKAQKPRQSRG